MSIHSVNKLLFDTGCLEGICQLIIVQHDSMEATQ